MSHLVSGLKPHEILEAVVSIECRTYQPVYTLRRKSLWEYCCFSDFCRFADTVLSIFFCDTCSLLGRCCPLYFSCVYPSLPLLLIGSFNRIVRDRYGPADYEGFVDSEGFDGGDGQVGVVGDGEFARCCATVGRRRRRREIFGLL